jgi:Family of unknown function (DUF5675)
MKLSLIRPNPPVSTLSTISPLYIDGNLFCHTLERPEVQIPVGTYSIEITESLDLTCQYPDGSLSHLLPLLDNVPGRTCIRIHGGNYPRDTEGCILVGFQVGQDMIMQSQAALEPLVAKIQAALASKDDVLISVV